MAAYQPMLPRTIQSLFQNMDITGLPEGIDPNLYDVISLIRPNSGIDTKMDVYNALKNLGALGVGDWSNPDTIWNTGWTPPAMAEATPSFFGNSGKYAFIPKNTDLSSLPKATDYNPHTNRFDAFMDKAVPATLMAAVAAAGGNALGIGNLFPGTTPTIGGADLLNYLPEAAKTVSAAELGLPTMATTSTGLLSGSELLDLLPESVKTVAASELGITDPVALSQALQTPSLWDKVTSKIPGFLSSSAGQALVGQVLGNIGNKSIRGDMEQMLRTIRDQNPFTGMGLEDIAKQNLASPVGQDQLNQLIGKMGQEMPFQGQAKTGFDRAASLVSDPTQNAGYNLATTGSRSLSDLYTNPLANPIMEAVSRLTVENAARRSAAGRGMNAGSMPAEMQDALMAALGGQFANLASGYGSGINAGSNFYNTETGAARDLGTAASNANTQYGNTLAGLASAINQAQGQQTNRASVSGDLASKHMNTLTNIMPAYFNNYLATNSTAGGVQRVANAGADNNLSTIASNLKAGKDIWNEVKSWNLF